MEQGLRFDWFSPGWRGDITMRGWRYVLMALGVFVWTTAIFLMVEGSVLGARTAGVAALLGVVGMFIILVTYVRALMLGKAEKSWRKI
jgi:K+-transporting ATPase A subunit